LEEAKPEALLEFQYKFAPVPDGTKPGCRLCDPPAAAERPCTTSMLSATQSSHDSLQWFVGSIKP